MRPRWSVESAQRHGTRDQSGIRVNGLDAASVAGAATLEPLLDVPFEPDARATDTNAEFGCDVSTNPGERMPLFEEAFADILGMEQPAAVHRHGDVTRERFQELVSGSHGIFAE